MTGRLGGQFGIPTLSSIAPDPWGLTLTAKRQILETHFARGETPSALEDAFHARVGGHAGAPTPVRVVIERLFTGCYPSDVGQRQRGQHSFVEAWVDLGDVGGRRVRFHTYEPECTVRPTDQLTLLGTALAEATIAVTREVR